LAAAQILKIICDEMALDRWR